jgi:hypothetical protein
MYPCQHPSCYSSQHGWTFFATFAYAPVPLYTRIRVAMHPCIQIPPHSPAMLHRILPVPPFPCLLASPSPCCNGGQDRQNSPIYGHSWPISTCRPMWHRLDKLTLLSVPLFPGLPVSMSPGSKTNNGCQEPHSACAIETRQPGALAPRSPVPMLPCLHVSMSLRRCYRPSSHCS